MAMHCGMLQAWAFVTDGRTGHALRGALSESHGDRQQAVQKWLRRWTTPCSRCGHCETGRYGSHSWAGCTGHGCCGGGGLLGSVQGASCLKQFWEQRGQRFRVSSKYLPPASLPPTYSLMHTTCVRVYTRKAPAVPSIA